MGEPCDTQGRESLPPVLHRLNAFLPGTTTVFGIKAKQRRGPAQYATPQEPQLPSIGTAQQKKKRGRPAKTPKALGDIDTEGHARKNTDHAEARYKVYPTAASISEEIERGDGGTLDEVTAHKARTQLNGAATPKINRKKRQA